MLVAKTHLRKPHGHEVPCRITAPTTWDHKYTRHEHPIRDVVEILSERGYLNLSIPVLVSFSLKGFWYAPVKVDKDSDFAPGSPCRVNSAGYLGSYAKVCSHPYYRDNLKAVDEGHFVNYTFNKEAGLTFTFDSLQTITKKAVLANHVNPRISFALFDIDFEDVHDECPGNVYGAFDRVAGIRWLTDRFKELLLTNDTGTT
ncbi:hypothetical protein V5799_015905 [Amblyomma americanum]|uniref:Uncharacterized protein n=1 Tax=Amblyomma americanum TaxID=6943 RepID=A0AAQ4F6I5_AMBAM